MGEINHVITGPETRLEFENRVISKIDCFLYTCGIIYYTGLYYKRNICYIELCV